MYIVSCDFSINMQLSYSIHAICMNFIILLDFEERYQSKISQKYSEP